jgi:hypothetical protein
LVPARARSWAGEHSVLPPDDWVMQPKIDGIRVIIYGGEPFNRLGQPLSESKGAGVLRAMFKGMVVTLDGEWVPRDGYHRSYEAHFAEVYATLPRSITEGVVFKRRASVHTKQRRASAETRDWLKRRYAWD